MWINWFAKYNTVPNVDKINNIFHIAENQLEMSVGSNEAEDIFCNIQKYLKVNDKVMKVVFEANKNPLQ